MKKIAFNKTILVYLTIFCLPPFFASDTLAQTSSNDRNPLSVRVLFNPPPEEGQPQQTTDAGSRSNSCLQEDALPRNSDNSLSDRHSLISIVPINNFGLTVAQRPVLSIYLPETSARQAVLSIKEEGNIHHSQTLLPISGKSGIVSFQLEEDSPPLEINKTYQWSVVLICGDRLTPNDPAISASIRRIALTETKIPVTALERASWYAERGVWYDALSSLLQARQSRPENREFEDIWVEFLDSQGLEKISTAPLQEL